MPSGRRQDVPYLVLGIALVVVGALGAVLLTSRAGDRVEALALVRDVPVGRPVTTGDLRVEPVLAGSSVPIVRSGDAGSVVGRVAAVPLRAGHLLGPDDVGAPAWPPPDRVVLAVAAASGTFPPELAAGMRVLVATGPPDGAGNASSPGGPGNSPAGSPTGDLADAPQAVVAAVHANPASNGGAVISLLLSRSAADAVTGVPVSRLRLIVVPAPAPSGPAPTPGGA